MTEINAKTEKPRLYYWDNLKAVLIFLVVIGHACAMVKGSSANMQALYFFIHIFHMPVFVFVSGMFARKTVETGHGMRARIIGFLVLGYLIKFADLGLELLFGKFDQFWILREGSISWYLFALAMWMPLSRALRNVDKRLLIVFSVIAACFAGYDETFGTYLILSRLLCFYPFFVMGLMWDPQKMPGKAGVGMKAAGVVVLAAAALVVIKLIGILEPYTEILRAMKSYYALPDGVNVLYGFGYRVLWYAAALVTGIALMMAVPAGKNFLTVTGERTLQIMTFHLPLLKLLRYLGFIDFLKSAVPGHYRILFVLTAVPLTILLTLPVFKKPVDKLLALCGK